MLFFYSPMWKVATCHSTKGQLRKVQVPLLERNVSLSSNTAWHLIINIISARCSISSNRGTRIDIFLLPTWVINFLIYYPWSVIHQGQFKWCLSSRCDYLMHRGCNILHHKLLTFLFIQELLVVTLTLWVHKLKSKWDSIAVLQLD